MNKVMKMIAAEMEINEDKQSGVTLNRGNF